MVPIITTAPCWVALTLGLLLWSWLAGTGMFDASLSTHIGGPYGLTAFLTALTLAAGARLADAIIPLREIWPQHQNRFRYALYALCGLGALAWLGIPGATLLTDIAIVTGSAAVAAYLFVCGKRGMKAAQVILPSAAAFVWWRWPPLLTSLDQLGQFRRQRLQRKRLLPARRLPAASPRPARYCWRWR